MPITIGGSPAGRTPKLPPGLAVQHLRTDAVLAPDGTVTGHTTLEAKGPYAIYLRRIAVQVEATGPERAASEMLRRQGTPGHGTLQIDARDPVGADYHVSGQFTLDKQSGWLEGETFVLPTGPRLLDRAGEDLIGSLLILDLPTSEPTPCWFGEQYEELSLTVLSGYRPARLTMPKQIVADAFSFDSRWSFIDGVLHDERRLVSHIDTPLYEGPRRAAVYTALQQFRRDLAAGYNWRALVEADISRFKRVIGGRLRFRIDRRRATEVAITVSALNRKLELGRPEYVRLP